MGLNNCHRLALPPTALIPMTCVQITEKSLSNEPALTPSLSGAAEHSSEGSPAPSVGLSSGGDVLVVLRHLPGAGAAKGDLWWHTKSLPSFPRCPRYAADLAGVRAACPGKVQSKYCLWMRRTMREGTSRGCGCLASSKKEGGLGSLLCQRAS